MLSRLAFCVCLSVAATEPPTFQELLASTPGFRALDVPAALELVTETSVPPKLGTDDMGERLLCFTVGAKEKLTLKMVSGGGDNLKVALHAVVPEHPFARVIKDINRMPPIMRAQKMEIPNPSAEPQQILVRISGMTKAAYKLVVKRGTL